MSAKKKTAAQLDIHRRLVRHVELNARVMDMLAECSKLEKAGKLAAAKVLLEKIERLHASMLELEGK